MARTERGTCWTRFTEARRGLTQGISQEGGRLSILEGTILICSPEPPRGTVERPSDSTAKDTGLCAPCDSCYSLLVPPSTWNNPSLYPHTAYHGLNKGAKPGHRPFFPPVLFSLSVGVIYPLRLCGCLETFLVGIKAGGGGGCYWHLMSRGGTFFSILQWAGGPPMNRE